MVSLPTIPVPPWLPATEIAVVVGIVASLLVVAWLDRTRDLGARRRARLVLGVPWGTVVTILFVLSVYLLVQGGLRHWYGPVVVAYRSWSYLYPLGMVVAPFAHQGANHLVGNLVGTVVLGSLAEYAWGHFPDERGVTTFSTPLRNPYARAFVAFPAGAVVVGLLTSLLSWGPVIGFSGVVFAFAGFALIRHPLLTVIALSADDVLRVVYRALREPVAFARAEPQFVEPWWAGISIQGHLLGLLLGLVAGVLLVRRREEVGALRLWGAALIVATSLSLWALWWFRGNARFVLFRGLGVLFVLAIALVVTLVVRAQRSEGTVLSVPTRRAAVLALVLPVLVIGVVAVPLNLTTPEDVGVPGDGSGVEVRDYTVAYAENVTNRMTSVVNLSAFGETTRVRASGVIVASEERGIWTTAVPASRLAFAGTARVRVGGLGWRESIPVRRRGWSAVGGPAAYRVWIEPPEGEWRLAYRSDPAAVEPVIAGANLTLRPTATGVRIELARNGSDLTSVAVPGRNETVTAGGVEFVREGKGVFAVHDGTRVRVATRETYRGAD